MVRCQVILRPTIVPSLIGRSAPSVPTLHGVSSSDAELADRRVASWLSAVKSSTSLHFTSFHFTSITA